MSGAQLGANALADAQAGGQDVINVLAETFSNFIGMILLLSVIGAGIWIVKKLYSRFTRSHRG